MKWKHIRDINQKYTQYKNISSKQVQMTGSTVKETNGKKEKPKKKGKVFRISKT